MAERERKMTRPFGGVFVARTTVMSSDDIDRAIWRMAHEIIEHNHGLDNVVVIGLQTGGVPLAARISEALAEITRGTQTEDTESAQDTETTQDTGDTEGGVPFGTIDVALHRDDIGIRPVMPEEVTSIPGDLHNKIVVLVDDVLFTGRTIRAALDALTTFGRPRSVQLAVMVDRGHRELPIRPDYVGKNIPTRRDEVVDVTLAGVQLGEMRK